MLSLIFLLPLWTMKTSWSRIDVLILTLVSPLLNFVSSQLAGCVPKRSHIASVRSGWEDPEKTLILLMVCEGTLIANTFLATFLACSQFQVRNVTPLRQPEEVPDIG